MKSISVVVVDDHKIVCEGLVSMLKADSSIEVKGMAHNMRESVSLLMSSSPDVLITDLNMPGKNGVPMISELREQFPSLAIIVLTMYYDSRLMKELEACNIQGFLLKNSVSEELLEAIHVAHKGGVYKQEKLHTFSGSHDFAISMDDEIKDSFARQYALGHRELEVLLLVALGKNSNEIAEALFISKETVSTHRKNIKKKIGLSNTAEIAVFAVRNQLI